MGSGNNGQKGKSEKPRKQKTARRNIGGGTISWWGGRSAGGKRTDNRNEKEVAVGKNTRTTGRSPGKKKSHSKRSLTVKRRWGGVNQKEKKREEGTLKGPDSGENIRNWGNVKKTYKTLHGGVGGKAV